MNKQTEETVYRGLLECPLKSGYIEFEYSEGDKVDDLLKTVREKWGENHEWTMKNPDDWRGRLGLGRGWLIACRDKSGAYFVLDYVDTIPVTTPPSGEIFDVPKSSGWYEHDGENGVYNIEAFGHPRNKHLKFPIVRDYDVPIDNVYTVKLIAIAAVTGG